MPTPTAETSETHVLTLAPNSGIAGTAIAATAAEDDHPTPICILRNCNSIRPLRVE